MTTAMFGFLLIGFGLGRLSMLVRVRRETQTFHVNPPFAYSDSPSREHIIVTIKDAQARGILR